MNEAQIKEMILRVCDAEINSKDKLCRLDSFVGDGDHGYTVERGFQTVKKEIAEKKYNSVKSVFQDTGDILADSMGGAIGMIIGALFTGGACELDDKPEIDEKGFSIFFSSGLEEIKMVGGAEEGDRTLVDALSPAVSAFKTAQEERKKLTECFQAAAKAAKAGAESTKGMMAKKGRAKFLQEKSLGYIDAGSVTMAIIIETMKEYAEYLEATA